MFFLGFAAGPVPCGAGLKVLHRKAPCDDLAPICLPASHRAIYGISAVLRLLALGQRRFGGPCRTVRVLVGSFTVVMVSVLTG